MFKICLIGCGHMAVIAHGPACKKYADLHEDAELSACCDLDIEKAESFRKEFGFQNAYTDYMEMLEKEKPDAVLAITPFTLTAKIAKDVIGTGTNIILEKPPGINAEEALSIDECAVENKVYARVAFNRRYIPIFSALVEELEACGEELLHVDCNFIRKRRTEDFFYTTAIHAIDSIKYLAKSDYKRADFHYQDILYDEKKVTNFYVNAEFENSVHANINFLPCSGCAAERIHASCRDYSFFAEIPVWNGMDMPGRLVCVRDGAVYKTVIGQETTMFESNGFYQESASFFDLIKQNGTPFSDVNTGVQPVEIAGCLRDRKPCYKK